MTTLWKSVSASPKTGTAWKVTGRRFFVLAEKAFHSSPTSVSFPFQRATAVDAIVVAHARRGSAAGISVSGPTRSPTFGAPGGAPGGGGAVLRVWLRNLILTMTVAPVSPDLVMS